MSVIADGPTVSGRHLRVEGETPYELRVWIDGTEAVIADPRVDVRVFRDGGTITISTDRGEVQLPHRIGDPDHRPRLDGEVVASAGGRSVDVPPASSGGGS